jgi:predicted DNA-binding transcriptional regulator YafY
MTKRTSINRYNLIMKRLKKCPATFQEINDYLERESELQDDDFTISKRTFQRDLEDIASLYNVEIEYDFSQKVYCIVSEDISPQNERIMEAFDTMNALSMSDKVSQYIQFEPRKSQGTEHLFGVLHAIKNRRKIEIVYKKYWDDEVSVRSLEPYALREYRFRWYIVAKDEGDNEIKTFGLDRIQSLEITKLKFAYPKDFSIQEYFKFAYGIIRPNYDNPEEIILSFNQYQGKYIKSQQMHHSQEILVDNENELRIKLLVFPTYDLVMDLMSYGQNVDVIQPESLKQELQEIYKNKLKDSK